MSLILVINPGSTSTKVAVFGDGKEVFKKTLPLHDDMLDLPLFPDQYTIRKDQILKELDRNGIRPSQMTAVAARGGRLKPLNSGVYRINREMVDDARKGLQGIHPANTAVVIAFELAQEFGMQAFTVDPISVDELAEWARVTGIQKITRNSLSHALNMKAVAKKAATELGKSYEEAKLIVAHLGGGSSVSAHLNGKMVDLYNSDKEGPFSVERAGALPTHELAEFARSRDDYLEYLAHRGGLFSHFGMRDVERIAEGVKNGEIDFTPLEAYIYNIAKYSYSLLAVFDGFPDALAITGGVVKCDYVRERLLEKLKGIRVLLFPGEFEMESLADGAHRVIRGIEDALEY